MRALSSPDRKQLEASVLAARRAAESASRAAIEALGVFLDRRPEHLDAGQAALRNGLRAKWRQLSGDRELLVAECAYEQWHRLLFARFLAENNLLLHPSFKTPVTLTDCEELAAELGEADAWSVAAWFAAEILPGIFRLDDPCVQLRLAPEGRDALERILEAIPAETFAGDDALGWVYQFWQKDKKDEVNASERKVGGADLGPVTQLFTENYMVRFLLENSLGAWWAARHPNSPLVEDFDYLRSDENSQPAGSNFDGWPDRVADVTVMDPCCGSGHFLVEAFSMLWRMRSEEECLSPVDAQDAVLRDNLFGLELDARCVQIAMFAVALQAWKAGGGWRPLPVPNIACSGIPVKAPVHEWEELAGGDKRLENALVRLHTLFRNADTLGSLIDPKRATEIGDSTSLQRSIEDVDWQEVGPHLSAALAGEDSSSLDGELVAAALDISRAAGFLAGQYTLVVTNVPFLTAGNYAAELGLFLDRNFAEARSNLGTSMLERCVMMCSETRSVWAVCFSGWLSAGYYTSFRRKLLKVVTPTAIVRFTSAGFSSPLWTFGLVLLGLGRPQGDDATLMYLDLESARSASVTNTLLRSERPRSLLVQASFASDENRFVAEQLGDYPLLSSWADGIVGMQTSDDPRYTAWFWEVEDWGTIWERIQHVPEENAGWSGCKGVVRWEGGIGSLSKVSVAWKGRKAWGRRGVIVSRFGQFRASLYGGSKFHQNAAVILPFDESLTPSILAYCQSPSFEIDVRKIDRSAKVTNSTLVKVPFDYEHWRRVAEEAGRLPEPWSDDPTQWLFEGRPEVSAASLQVAVARLVGYRWPEQAESDDLDRFADADGVVCLPPVAGEPPAADRLHQLLAAAYGETWSPARLKELLEQAGSKKKNVAEWLRDDFFKQHGVLFGNRPFVWHVWDGLRDGFSALVNYHRLDRRMLEKLTYTYLGQDWVERQRAGVRDEVAGAQARLSAALGLQGKLELILEGEKPFDIFVRWKELHEQPVGWEPDLNDGVRLNVRPFVETGVLRAPFNIHWKKDRGKNPDGTERVNDTHLTLAAKLDARKRAGRA